jgi:hypothetical protein
MNIGGYAIRPFVVCIQELPERTDFILKHFKERGVEAEIFNGISAKESGLVTEYPYEIDAPNSGYKIGRSPTACWVSMYMLWSAMLYMPQDFFWQLEFDCQFPQDWRPKMESIMRDVPPDFDIIMVGNCCAKDKPTRHIAGSVFEVKYPCCGHSSIIAKKALPVILKTQRKIYAPIDLSLIYHTFPMLKVYTVLPSLCSQFNTYLQP